MELREKVANLPTAAGVYLFQDAGGTILYVGKARSLRNRVRLLLSGIQLAGCENRLARARNRRPRLHRRRQRKRGARARKQPDQAAQAEIQRAAARRQNLSLHSLHRIREISARLRDAPPEKRRLDLFRPVLPCPPRLPDGEFDPQAFSGAVVHGGPDAAPSAALPAILHSPLPGPLRRGAGHRRALCRSRARRSAFSRRAPQRSFAQPEGAHGSSPPSSSDTRKPPAIAICCARSPKWRSARKSPRPRETIPTCSHGTPSRRRSP